MSPEQEALAREVVTLPGWQWMPGMLARYGDGSAWRRVHDGDGYGFPHKVVPPNPRAAYPDLTDALTALGLLVLVRRAWGDETAYCRTQARGGRDLWISYIVQTHGNATGPAPAMGEAGDMLYGDTEAAALVAALRAAPHD